MLATTVAHHCPCRALCAVPNARPPHCAYAMPNTQSHPMPTALSQSHTHLPHHFPPLSHIPSLPYANGYKEHLIILVNCLYPPLFPPGDFLTNGVQIFPFVFCFSTRDRSPSAPSLPSALCLHNWDEFHTAVPTAPKNL